jgi:hypothetical protein
VALSARLTVTPLAPEIVTCPLAVVCTTKQLKPFANPEGITAVMPELAVNKAKRLLLIELKLYESPDTVRAEAAIPAGPWMPGTAITTEEESESTMAN